MPPIVTNTPTASTNPPAQAITLPELPGINVTDGLSRVRNKVDFYRRMLIKFRDIHAAELARDLQNHLASGMRPEAIRTVHSLKGVALSLGIDELGEMAADVEAHLKDMTETNTDALTAPLLSEIEKVRTVLAALD
jgi:HPt (histidine-containing phosphotransfer) domain-containing protein